MLENKLFEALLDVIPFRAYAVDVESYEVVYANKKMRENMYAPQETYCWEKVFGQEQICSWCTINSLQNRVSKKSNDKLTCEFFDECDDKWLKSYDELISWPDGRDVKYSILVDITDQKEIQGDMIKAHAKLAMHSKQLKSTNKNLQITKLTLQKTINELEEQKQKAETATAFKSQFLANMSHEIRTPMNAVVGMSNLLRQTNLDNTQKDYLQKIQSSSKILLNIINDILDLSKIEAGKIELENIDFNIQDVVQNIQDIISYKVLEKNIEFSIQNNLDKEHQVFFGDPFRLGQILLNLLTNAVKFTHKGKVELIISNYQNEQLSFDVIDTGVGLSQTQIEKLFKSFSQADLSTTRKYGGTGLGLTISKEIAKLMNGDINVTSEKDKGSIFHVDVKLPLGDIQNIKYISKDQITKLEQELHTLQNSSILLVEDNSINQEIIVSLLKPYNIFVEVANDGQEGLELFEKNSSQYDLILMDIHMPRLDGYEATKIIRQQNKTIPIIALSANVLKVDIEKTKAIGMNDYLMKPIEIDKFFTLLLEYIHPTLETLNVHLGLSYMNKNEKLYAKIIEQFYEKYHDLNFKLLEEDNFEITLHTIKGLSKSIGAMKLHHLVNALYEKYDKKLMDKCQEELEKVIGELQTIVTVEKKASLKIKVSQQTIQEDFKILKEKIKTKRPKEIKPILEKIDNYELNEIDLKRYTQIKNYLQKFDFKNALAIFETNS
jgi:signal transduction histidine kinase/CheY-like chemotaxis protein